MFFVVLGKMTLAFNTQIIAGQLTGCISLRNVKFGTFFLIFLFNP